MQQHPDFFTQARRIHAAHYDLIKNIYAGNGNKWPDLTALPATAINQLAILIIHQFCEKDRLAKEDAKIFKTFAPHLYRLAHANCDLVSKSNFATLADKIARYEGRKQSYGTQFVGSGKTYPSLNPAQLVARRARIDLAK